MGRNLSSSIFRWPEFDFSSWTLPSTIFRWPEFDFSGLMTNWVPSVTFRWPHFDFSIVDNMLWTLVTLLESVVLAAMLCFFFVCCGCCSL